MPALRLITSSSWSAAPSAQSERASVPARRCAVLLHARYVLACVLRSCSARCTFGLMAWAIVAGMGP